MRITPEYMQALAEAVTPLARELTVGLIQRPYPAQDRAAAGMAALCRETFSLLEEATGVLHDLLGDLENCPLEDLDGLLEELSGPALDLVDMSQKIWSSRLPEPEEKARLYLAAIIEAPAMELLDFFFRIMQAALDPWGTLDNPDAPELRTDLTFSCHTEKSRLKALQQAFPTAVPCPLPF